MGIYLNCVYELLMHNLFCFSKIECVHKLLFSQDARFCLTPNDHCTLQNLFLWLISWQYCNVLVYQPKALRTLDMYEVVTLTSKTRNSLSTKACEVIHCCDGATCQCTFYESLLTSSEICCCLAVLLGPERLYCYTVSQT